jgi:hypothetical protein
MHDPKSHNLFATGQCSKKISFCFSLILDGFLALTFAIFRLKMLKSRKSAQPTEE